MSCAPYFHEKIKNQFWKSREFGGVGVSCFAETLRILRGHVYALKQVLSISGYLQGGSENISVPVPTNIFFV